MERNMGTLDRGLRAVVAAPALIVLGLVVFDVGGVLSVLALVVAGVMLATSAVGVCPAYVPLGLSTRSPTPAGGGPGRVATQR